MKPTILLTGGTGFLGSNLLKKLLSELHTREIISVLVEGGGEVLGNFINEDLLDKVHVFYAPIVIGSERSVAIGRENITRSRKLSRLEITSTRRFGDNLLVIAERPRAGLKKHS